MNSKNAAVRVMMCLCLAGVTPLKAQENPFGNCDPYEELRCAEGGVKWNKDTCTCGDSPPTPRPPVEPLFGEFAYEATVTQPGFGKWYGGMFTVENTHGQSPLMMNISNRLVFDHVSSVTMQLNGYSAGLLFDPHGYGLGRHGSIFFGKINLNPTQYNNIRQNIVVGVWEGQGFRYVFTSDTYVYPASKDTLAITRRGDHYSFTWNQRQVYALNDTGGRAGPVALMVGPRSVGAFENWRVRTNRR